MRWPAGAASSRSCRLRPNTRIASASASSRSRLLDLGLELRQQLDLPGPPHRRGEPGIRGAAPVDDAGARGDAPFGFRRTGRGIGVRQHDRETKDAFVAAAEQRQHAVRRETSQRLAGVEVVGELRAFLLLAVDDGGRPLAAIPEQLAKAADQLRILGETVGENPARAVEGGRHVRNAFLGVDIRKRGRVRHQHRIAQQRRGERLEAGFPRDLRLRPPLGLVGQVQIFEPRLGIRGGDRPVQLGRELALLLDALADRGAPLVELAKVVQPFLERAELGVVESAGGFLPVARDERNGGPGVEERDGGLGLGRREWPVLRQYVRRRTSSVGTILVSRVRNTLSTEGGDAPGWQGAKSENSGTI